MKHKLSDILGFILYVMFHWPTMILRLFQTKKKKPHSVEEKLIPHYLKVFNRK